MGDGFAPWMAFLYATAIRISVVLLITLVALKLLRRASAASRSLVYAAAIVLIVAVPFGKKMPALYPAEVLPSVLAAPLVEAGILSFATTLQPIVRELGGEPVQQAALASATLLVVVVLVVWFCGFAFVLARTVLQWRRMVHIQRTASVCSDRQLNELLAAAQRSIGYSAQVRLLVHDTHDAPFSWCVLRPVMVIPAPVVQWPLEWQRALLLHELAHARNRDSIMRLVGILACALYWFHPGAWWVARRHREERERACDDVVMRSGCDASGYALMLLAIDEAGVQGAAPLFVAQGIGRGASLRERVVRLATPRARANDAAFLRTFVLAVLLAFIGGTGVALTTIRLAPSRSVTHGLLESSHWLRRGYALGIMSGAGMLRPSNAERLALFNVAKRSDPHPVNRAIASYALSHNIRATRMSRPALVR